MINIKCFLPFMVALIISDCSVFGFHPMVQSLSPKTSKSQNSDPESLGEQDFPLNPDSANNEIEEYQKNYLRENDDVKRTPPKNFLRFGKSDSPFVSALYDQSNVPIEEEKRIARNFLRFGRVPERNFLRFGRGGPMESALGLGGDASSELIKRGYDKNFLRFGKSYDRNYLRFGRSISKQNQNEDDNQEVTELSRKKRSIMYDDEEPITGHWAYDLGGPSGPRNLMDDGQLLAGAQKRGYNTRNFLRYGRDPLDLHFLRFGKRSQEPEEFPIERVNRGSNIKNFLRYG